MSGPARPRAAFPVSPRSGITWRFPAYVGEGFERIGGKLVPVFYVLGGNQGDRVSIMALEASRCIAARWPAHLSYAPRPVQMASGGKPLSRNEA